MSYSPLQIQREPAETNSGCSRAVGSRAERVDVCGFRHNFRRSTCISESKRVNICRKVLIILRVTGFLIRSRPLNLHLQN